MPANLTPDYLEAEERLRAARTPEEKVSALEEMLRTIPKHKGTDHIQADIKKRLAEARRESQKKPATARSVQSLFVKPEGVGQVFLVGPANSGKSSLVSALTSARAEVAPYPFTTQMFLPGMMLYENVWIQLVDMPPVSSQSPLSWIPSVIRYGNAAWLVVSLASDDILSEYEEIISLLAGGKVRLGASGEPTVIAPDGIATLRTLLVATHCDAPGASDRLELLHEVKNPSIEVVQVDCSRPETLEPLRQHTFTLLNVIRIYGKESGKPVDRSDPFVLSRGATVQDLAAKIHRDLAPRLAYARVWANDASIDGLRVPREYELQDGQTVQLAFS